MALTTLAIDGHVHLYTIFDLARAIEAGRKNLLKLAKKNNSAKKAVPVWLLVERSDTDMFAELKKIAEKNENRNGFSFEQIDSVTIAVKEKDARILFIFAGRQLVTAENLEVLSLISDFNLADRAAPLDEVIGLIEQSQGIPALNWAPGKWFAARGRVVEKMISENAPEKFFIGDSTMRNTLWSTPKLVKKAKKKGFAVLAGSDPLPFSGEEKMIGSYGFLLEGDFSAKNPAELMRKILRENRGSIRIVGKRNNPFTFVLRQYKIMREKKTRNN
ncbi:MAG: hypothetical protein GXO74_03340 [Calditrichaeota bacterium]|nr:hypothetical protein [Calditrichota bacterium]